MSIVTTDVDLFQDISKLPSKSLYNYWLFAKMYTIIQKIKWPLVLCDFVFKNFNTNYRTLELLNLKESRLREIRFSGGHVKELSIDLFPVSVENLTLMEMGIHELSASFESLKNLYRLSLMGNQLRNVNSVKLPVSSFGGFKRTSM